MIIKKIILENIKSYIYEEINLSEGINCILGLNGSGKSTIIESIGLALFNYSKGNITSLLRYNERRGLIKVYFIANDSREYIVERIIRTNGSSVRIIDAQNNTELYSGVSDVYSFIKKVLKITKTKSFSQMFSEIIAVPQGEYVSAFLLTPTLRKENFDRLFNLHIYKKLGFRIKEIYDKIQNERVYYLKEEIDQIIGKTSDYNRKKEKLDELLKVISSLLEKEKDLQLELNNVSKNKEKLEKTKKELEEHTNKINLLDSKIISYSEQINASKENLIQSQKAEKIVNDNIDGYLKYQENQKLIGELEKKLDYFIESEKRIKIFENDLNLQKNKKMNLIDRINEKTTELNTIQKEMQKLNSELVLLNTRLTNTKELYEKVKLSVDEKQNNIIERKKLFSSSYNNLQTIKIKLNSIEYVDESIYQNKLDELSERLKEYDKIKSRIEILEKEKAIIEANLKEAIKNSQISVDGNCPFFNTKCKNIGEMSLNDYFNNEIIKLNQKYNDIENEINNLSDFVKENINEQIIIVKQKLEESKKNKSVILEIDRIISSMIEQENISIDEKIIIYENKLKEEEKNITDLEAKVNEEKENLLELRTKIDTLQFTIQTKDKQFKEYENTISEIKKTVFDCNARIKEIDDYSYNLNEKIIKAEEEAKENNVKEELDSLKQINISLEEKKNLYLENINKAKEKNSIENKIKELSNFKNSVIKELNELKENKEKLLTNYSEENYMLLKNKENNLIKDISFLKSSINEKNLQKDEEEKEIKYLENLINIKEIKQKELEKYLKVIEFLKQARTIYNNLPQKLSERYREYISHASTLIYQKIASENVTLEITEDYEVRLKENANSYKTMDQLSGGEQMSCALAIRLSMLKHLSGLDIYFLDEPTINLDIKRREKIADIVLDVASSLSQLFVISHDDTFDNITDAIIKLRKENNVSRIM